MGISIKHDEYERLIRRLAAHKNSSITDAIGTAVRHELEREGIVVEDDREAAGREFLERVRALRAEIAQYPIVDTRTADEIIGYDENGLPS